MASSGDEFGIVTGGTIAPLTDDYENWRQYGASPIVAEVLTMSFSIVATSTSITFNFGDVNSSSHGTFSGSATTSLTNVLGLSPYSTLWIGLESKMPDNSFSITNSSLNGDGIIDTTANGVSFAGFQTSVGSSWTLAGDFQTIHPENPYVYSGSGAGFYVFGDNTAVVPEPSSVLLIALSGFSLILRRKR
jgi:FlaG/FlaF family flagellin (archaellin)